MVKWNMWTKIASMLMFWPVSTQKPSLHHRTNTQTLHEYLGVFIWHLYPKNMCRECKADPRGLVNIYSKLQNSHFTFTPGSFPGRSCSSRGALLLQFSHQRFPSLSADTGSIDPCGHMTAVLTYRPVVLSRGVISLCQSAVKRLKDKKKNT